MFSHKNSSSNSQLNQSQFEGVIALHQTGIANLPLHHGRAPRWLVVRMQRLAKEVVTIIVNEYGLNEFLRRISDPFWFQAFGCVLGYDWHSSGVTTVVTAVLKKAISPEDLGITVCGGKGKFSRQTLPEIEEAALTFGLSTHETEMLKYASKMSAKVDNAAIQAGYSLYHHAFFLTEGHTWAVVQQGMCGEDRTARRYHWLSDHVKSFVVEPHSAIVGDAERENVLNMTARESEACRKASVDLAKEKPSRLMRTIPANIHDEQKTLSKWLPNGSPTNNGPLPLDSLSMPLHINWKTLERIYEFQPSNYEELLGLKGVGPATVRGLALVADLVYGQKPSWKDPVKYSFAYGGKDGVPHPVNREAMDESILILKHAVQESRIGDKEKLHSLQRLRWIIPQGIDK